MLKSLECLSIPLLCKYSDLFLWKGTVFLNMLLIIRDNHSFLSLQWFCGFPLSLQKVSLRKHIGIESFPSVCDRAGYVVYIVKNHAWQESNLKNSGSTISVLLTPSGLQGFKKGKSKIK